MPRRSSNRDGGIGPALAISVVLHVAIVIAGVPLIIPEADESEERESRAKSKEPMRVEVVERREQPDPPDEAAEPTEEREPRERREPDERKPREKPEKDEEKQKKSPPKPEQNYNRKAVVQETDEERPEEADFVSEKANETDEETRARETVQKFVEPSESAPRKKREPEESTETKSEKRGARASAAEIPKPAKSESRPPRPRESSPERERKRKSERKEAKDRKGPGPKPSEERAEQEGQSKTPERLPMPSVDDYSKVFDAKADRRRRRREMEKGVGHEMFREIEKSKGSVKATLENYIPEVKPGNHTSVNAHADVAATYVNRIHSKIHPQWGNSFLPQLDRKFGPGHPLSNSDLNAVLEFVIDGESGELEEVTIVSSSGQTFYDMTAVSIAESVAPHPNPPEEIVSPDGNIYMHWNFWRDQRQCGTFGVHVYRLNEEGGREKTDRP